MNSAETESERAPSASATPATLDELRAALDAMRASLAATSESPAAWVDLYVRCTDLLRLVEDKIRELQPDAELKPDQLVSVCILLGPYRNLTTLTASVLGLHPQCVVLNHAGRRTLRNPRLNFLADYSPEKFAEFVRYAGFAARRGERGMHGGDIRLSHAYDREAMREADAKLRRAPARPVRCLVWKESQKVANLLHSEHVDVRLLLQSNPKLKFLLPVRNPIDCAMSNLRSGHVQFFSEHHGVSRASSLEAVLSAVLDEIAWFVALRRSLGPDAFFMFFEHEMGRDVLEKLLRFLRLPEDEAYLATAAEVFKVDRTPRKDARIVARYAELVGEKFSGHAEIRDALLEFVPR